ncbi:Spx/MgsR family RNA polymerase-binding regulatory protein [Pedobacter sp. MW01-1-1]|uniref:Spx/MgsR family RNA polymerase-binding regulatory protein n=1 Tax=Pedobacter sp. MW01-1-1 TaxID=3383027 RepID=UPI003FF0B5BC
MLNVSKASKKIVPLSPNTEKLKNIMVVYGIPNCNTVKKAIDWLKENNLEFEFHDFKKKGISPEKLNQWCATFGWEVVLNRKGLTWKKLSKEQQAEIKSQEDAVAYLLQNTSAIKRPVIEKDNDAVFIGFDADSYLKLLS